MLKKIVLALVLTCGASFALAQQPKMGGVANAVIQPEPPGLMLAMIQNGLDRQVSANSSMIRKSGHRFSLATNAEGVCAEIMLNQKDRAG
jgi:hypothetical protein